MTCKDCIHYDVCAIIEDKDEDYLTEYGCDDFKPKYEYDAKMAEKECDRYKVFLDKWQKTLIEKARTEAIIEFAYKLKKNESYFRIDCFGRKTVGRVISIADIDSVMKQMLSVKEQNHD